MPYYVGVLKRFIFCDIRYMSLLRFSMYHILDAICFSRVSGLRIEARRITAFSTFALLHHMATFSPSGEDTAQKIPPGLKFQAWFYGSVWVWMGYGTEKTRRRESFFLFLSFVIDTSQLHYSPVVFDADEALASFSSIN